MNDLLKQLERVATEFSMSAKAREIFTMKASMDAMTELERMARFEEGVSADPTQNMSEEDAQKWQDMNDEHGDNFKTAFAELSKLADDPMADLEILAEGCPDNLDAEACKEWEANTDKYQDVVKDQHKEALDALTKLAGEAASVSLSKGESKSVADLLEPFNEPGSWSHVVTYAVSGKAMEPKHVQKVVKDIDGYLESWDTYAKSYGWSDKDKKNLTKAKGILEKASKGGSKKTAGPNPLDPTATWDEGSIDWTDDPRDHESEGSMIPGLEDRMASDKKAGFSFAEDDAYFSFVGNKTPFNVDMIRDIQDLEIRFLDDEGEWHEDRAIKVMRPSYSPPLTHMQEMTGLQREAIVQVRFPDGALPTVAKVMEMLGRYKKFQVELLHGFREPKTVQGPAPKQPAKKPFPFRAADDDQEGIEAKFEEGVSADPTKNMSPEDAAEWKKQNEDNKDNFKAASSPYMEYVMRQKSKGERSLSNTDWSAKQTTKRHRDNLLKKADDLETMWGTVIDASLIKEAEDKTASLIPSGLYGYTRAVQSSCEGSIRKMTRMASKIAKAAYQRDENVAPFLAAHAKRANSMPAKVLVAAMKQLGPKIASDMRLAELRVEKDMGKPIDKVAARKYGLYGYVAKTASLGLSACVQVREVSGTTASDLHGRKAAEYNLITGFLKEHTKQSKCLYAKLLHESYPDQDRKTASFKPCPKSVNEWLSWED